MPPVLTQTLYIDMHTIGLEAAIAQIVSVAQGSASFTPQHLGFSNLTYTATTDANGTLNIVIAASHLLEPNPNFMVLVGNSQNELGWDIPGAAGFEGGFFDAIKLDNGTVHNGVILRRMNEMLTPSHPARLRLWPNRGAKFDFKGILHEAAEHRWVPVANKTS